MPRELFNFTQPLPIFRNFLFLFGIYHFELNIWIEFQEKMQIFLLGFDSTSHSIDVESTATVSQLKVISLASTILTWFVHRNVNLFLNRVERNESPEMILCCRSWSVRAQSTLCATARLSWTSPGPWPTTTFLASPPSLSMPVFSEVRIFQFNSKVQMIFFKNILVRFLSISRLFYKVKYNYQQKTSTFLSMHSWNFILFLWSKSFILFIINKSLQIFKFLLNFILLYL